MMPAFISATPELRQDIEYTRVQGVGLQLDASIPEGPGPHPAAILVHGGGWVRGDRRIDVAPLFEPLSSAGFAWFSISYRMAKGAYAFGSAVNDVEDAIRFVKTHAVEFRVDPNRLVLIGESAGGQLAGMAALNSAPELAVKGVVAFYAPTDLVALAQGSNLVPPSIRASLDGSPLGSLILARLAQLSPVQNLRREMPPFLLIHGGADRLVPFEQSRVMCEKMRAVGASCELFKVDGGGHGIRWWESSPKLSTPYKGEMLRWLKKQLVSEPEVSGSSDGGR
jgi:alpha-L-fucosidase 2